MLVSQVGKASLRVIQETKETFYFPSCCFYISLIYMIISMKLEGQK